MVTLLPHNGTALVIFLDFSRKEIEAGSVYWSTASTFPLPYIWAGLVLNGKSEHFWDFGWKAQNSN